MDYRTGIVSSLAEIGESAWSALLATQPDANPFLSYAFLHALHESGSAAPDAGWQPQYLALWQGEVLAAAMPLYVKSHSYGEYVFDWAWADAYQRNGLDYYPKLLSAIPFTPVAGARLLARDPAARAALVGLLCAQQEAAGMSSTHVLFPPEEQAQQLQRAGFMLRSGVQFHWLNPGYGDFEAFLATLEHKKRKNIRAERRKVREAGVTMRQVRGADAGEADWRLFHRCYANTYAEHRSSPYLNLDFFLRIGRAMPQNILLVIAERDGRDIAASLVIHSEDTLFGRYWGALEHVPCLHFETSYYQPLEFCIAQNIATFEGGAQGEHKMARGFLPQKTWSAHWLAHPAFADAIERFLEHESGGIDSYIDELNDRNPFRQGGPVP
ncbi:MULTISPECIES: GNAT family N-acetyltransferase [unclassified Janthinobacterium]|uniref:GNAT family N-acetyltransferase n=1 Tax=unclassified Janthinobacterium TaxID=2610881 RepID=UPI00035E8B97|nr:MULTISPECIES: GNAT family N-acetyltransferase [unclassified Janthinobacterium]MEC5162386.1 putative N-acyltransferase [Janthinobacterium sp. CG_S6]